MPSAWCSIFKGFEKDVSSARAPTCSGGSFCDGSFVLDECCQPRRLVIGSCTQRHQRLGCHEHGVDQRPLADLRLDALKHRRNVWIANQDFGHIGMHPLSALRLQKALSLLTDCNSHFQF